MTPRLPLWFDEALEAPAIRQDDLRSCDMPRQRVRFGWLRNPLVRLLVFGATVLLGSLTAATFVPGLLLGEVSGSILAVLQVVIVVASYLVLVLALEGRRPPDELRPGRWPGLLVGLALGALLFAACFGIIALFGGYRFEGVDPGYQWLEPVLMLGVGAGVAEELIFRGVLFRLLEEWLGTWFAAGISGLAFGFLHLGNPEATIWGATAIALEAGVMFALLYALTRSLWLVIGFHASWNLVQGPVLGVPVSGSGFSDGWLNTVTVGPDWLTGGSFGAEASLVTVALLVGFTIFLAVRLQHSAQVVEPVWSRRMELRDRQLSAG
ncbi:MAG: type II CAAX endopeptidase family protein [Micropruina sp.]|nr:CPBP family intramembrane metalloprotease [Micropruina sp.]